MKVVKIKYRGEWRTIIGQCLDGEGHLCYKVQCLDNKKYYNAIRINDYHIEDKVEKDVKRYPSYKRRYNELTKEEKDKVYDRFKSGAWTLKQICDMFNITRLTVKKIVGVL